MLWLFECSTKNCFLHENPCYLVDAINPVLCSLCHQYTDATETDQPAPTAEEIAAL